MVSPYHLTNEPDNKFTAAPSQEFPILVLLLLGAGKFSVVRGCPVHYGCLAALLASTL